MIAATDTVAKLADRRAAQTPDAAAFLEADGTTVTFSAILSEAQAVARGLAALARVASLSLPGPSRIGSRAGTSAPVARQRR